MYVNTILDVYIYIYIYVYVYTYVMLCTYAPSQAFICTSTAPSRPRPDFDSSGREVPFAKRVNKHGH